MDLILYTADRSRGLMIAWLLEELGVPYRTRCLDLASGEHKDLAYRAVHPLGSVPALVIDGEPMVESLAMALFLADACSAGELAPLPGHPDRSRYLQWMVYATATLEPKLAAPFVRSLGVPVEDWPEVSTDAERRSFSEVLGPLAASFPRGHILPSGFSAVDLLLGVELHWADQVGLLAPESPARSYVSRLRARPSWARLVDRSPALSTHVLEPPVRGGRGTSQA